MPADMNPHKLADHVIALSNGSSPRQVEAFVEDLLNAHPTLQQQIWSIFVRFIVEFSNKDPKLEVDERNRYAWEQSCNIVNFMTGDPCAKSESYSDIPWRVPIV